MGEASEQAESPSILWQRHTQSAQRWLASGFRDGLAARDAQRTLHEWLGAYPNQVGDVRELALSAAFTALHAGAFEHAEAFAEVAVEGTTFAPLRGAVDHAAAALSALILAAARLERGKATDAQWALQYAGDLTAQMDPGTALHQWARSQHALIAGAMAEAILERQRAAAHYQAAREGVEPLLRNPRLRRELINDWLGTVFGNAQQLTGQSEAAGSLVRDLVSSHFVQAAVGAARVASRETAAADALIAAAACEEFGVPRQVTGFELHAALECLADDVRTDTLDKLLLRFERGSDRTSRAVTAVLLGLRARTTANSDAVHDIARAGKAAIEADDVFAWVTTTSDMIEHTLSVTGKLSRSDFDTFWMLYAQGEDAVRQSPRHLPFRAAFERTLALAAQSALTDFAASSSADARVWLSACLEARRSTDTPFAPSREGMALTGIEQARRDANDWLGRIQRAVRDRPDTLVLIPAAKTEGTVLLCIAADTDGVEAHPADADYEAALRALAAAMYEHFASRSSGLDLVAPGTRAFASLPKRVRELLGTNDIVLLLPDAASDRQAVPYELLHGSKGFLGISHVLARLPSLRAAAFALEPVANPRPGSAHRAVCVAAPDTIAAQPLRFAAAEVAGVKGALSAADWTVPALDEEQVSPDLLLKGLELGTLVHVAAHGEAVGGTHAILLPRDERLTTEEVAAYRGELPAFVYLSVCSVGASEYLGGGVSRGMASALSLKGASAIIASQWPLQDAAAATFARKFYDVAREATVGEAMRAARAHVAESVAPALWGSLILIGNPWHSFDARDHKGDAATKLLTASSGPGRSAKVRAAAIKAARTALKRDPAHPRLAAALAWAQEFAAISGDGISSAAWADQMADIARDLGASAGEVRLRSAVFDLHVASGNDEAARRSLDRAIDVGEQLVRSDASWTETVHALLAKRQTSDLSFEVPEVRLSSGMVVNDRSDPAVRAFFQVQHAVDQREVRTSGTLRPRVPEGSLRDVAWNAVVLGQRRRFGGAFACAALCTQLASRAVSAGLIEASLEADARRVLAGMLRYLWPTQRMTHLERELALGQAGTVLTALEALSSNEVRTQDQQADARQSILEASAKVMALSDEPTVDRFARARARLRGEMSRPDAAALASDLAAFITAAPDQSALRAHRAAWGYGLLLEMAYNLRIKGNAVMADRILSDYAELEQNAQQYLWGYLVDGFGDVRGAALDPLIGWRSRDS